MLKQLSSKMKRVLTISFAILLVVPLTAVLASADHIYQGPGNYQTYYDRDMPGHITTSDTPLYYDNGVPVFEEQPSGVNTGDIEILNRRRSPGTPEGGSS